MNEPTVDYESKNSSTVRNVLIAIVAVVLSVALFIGLQSETNSGSLEALVRRSIPLEDALSNGKPTLTEFYADWCTSCQAMAEDLSAIENSYEDRVNFVMLNVDNNKWLPEMLRYRVDGIPHFVFMDREGEAIAEAIGEQPRSILEADLEALIASNPIPYAYEKGAVSQLDKVATQKNSDPRNHGGK
ncbi:thioredoxin family protein [Myxosarcina sp. GI1]|uniref:thioredoxin family protein n=1 Tax=Myxosarcina sp. GI1 TaxID=1541065 RepID=UPI000566F1C4|nr:thioredoxin family protein [Myxosarcina sp. GI1]